MYADVNVPGTTNGKSRSQHNGKRSHHNATAAPGSSSRRGDLKSRPPERYLGHDRGEVTRILLQTLVDMGYEDAAEIVSRKSGYDLESVTVAAFRTAVLGGDWSKAEELLDRALPPPKDDGNSDDLVLANGADTKAMKFWIRQQKYLELLEQNDHNSALDVLRREVTPLFRSHPRIRSLSGLIMCQSNEDLYAKANWDGAGGNSRQILLTQLSKCISPSVMLPEHRLADLLQQVKEYQITSCVWHSNAEPLSLYSDHVCQRVDFPAETVRELEDHEGEVWQVVFSYDGTKLASCGSDKQVIIWEVPSFNILHRLKDHDAGVGNVAWSWDDSMLVTCGRDRCAMLWDVKTGNCLQPPYRFNEPVSSCIWSPDNESFITGSLDKAGSLVQWNLAGEKIHDWNCPQRVEELTVSPDGRWLVAMDCEKHIHVYNFETRDFEYTLDLKTRLTSVSISQNSRHLLVNQTDGCAQLIDLVRRVPLQHYTGHKGGEYVIRASLGGADEMFVISGSEDGCIYIWNKSSTQGLQRLVAHDPRCNSVAWCPTDPQMFASCGDDGKIKIWSNNKWKLRNIEAPQNNNNNNNNNVSNRTWDI